MPSPSGPNSTSRLWLLTRPDCGLCEEFAAALAAIAPELQLPQVDVIDIDQHPELARRHGLDIPVLLWDGVLVCRHHLDREELRRLMRQR